jgi:hypothetical protein
VSAETPQPQPGDVVEVRYKATYVHESDGQHVLDVADGMGPIHMDAPAWATVEVLERADDPGRDKVGTQRDMSTPDDATAGVNHAEIGNWAVRWTTDKHSDTPWVWFRWDGPQLLSNETVAGRPVIGVVPGTPAAEARAKQDAINALVENAAHNASPRPSVRVPNEPHGIPNEVRQRIVEWLEAGDQAAAVRALQHATGMHLINAVAYVESMSEYQTYLEQQGGKRETCTRDDCPAATRCSSGATVWHDRTPECGDPS